MPCCDEHCKQSLERYRYEFREVHTWMDEPSQTAMSFRHQVVRHDPYHTPIDAMNIFFDKIPKEFRNHVSDSVLDHIVLDEKEKKIGKLSIKKNRKLKVKVAVNETILSEIGLKNPSDWYIELAYAREGIVIHEDEFTRLLGVKHHLPNEVYYKLQPKGWETILENHAIHLQNAIVNLGWFKRIKPGYVTRTEEGTLVVKKFEDKKTVPKDYIKLIKRLKKASNVKN
jgi:hypothetical protein